MLSAKSPPPLVVQFPRRLIEFGIWELWRAAGVSGLAFVLQWTKPWDSKEQMLSMEYDHCWEWEFNEE